MSWGIVASVGGTVVGGMMASDAAGDAADAQAGAAAASDATQRYFYDTTRADNAPFRDTGLAANNQLAMLMGLQPGSGLTREQLRSELLGQYTTTTPGASPALGYQPYTADAGPPSSQIYQPQQSTTSVNEAGLTNAIEARLQQQAKEQAALKKNPSFGSLARNFNASDLRKDPVYQSGLQFGLDQGTQGINRQAAAGGNFLSGATLKALTRFGNDYGSTKANESYNRFNNNQTQQYNRLAGLSGAGQQATNEVSAAGQSAANAISASQQGAGNARASGYVGQANAWNSAIGQGVNAFQQNQLMGSMFGSQPSSASQSTNFFDGTGAWRA